MARNFLKACIFSILPELVKILGTSSIGDETFICSKVNQTFIKENFSNAFQNACNTARIKKLALEAINKLQKMRDRKYIMIRIHLFPYIQNKFLILFAFCFPSSSIITSYIVNKLLNFYPCSLTKLINTQNFATK